MLLRAAAFLTESLTGHAVLRAFFAGARRMTIAGCRVRVLTALLAGTRRMPVACGGIIGRLIAAAGLILRKAALIRLICHLGCLLIIFDSKSFFASYASMMRKSCRRRCLFVTSFTSKAKLLKAHYHH